MGIASCNSSQMIKSSCDCIFGFLSSAGSPDCTLIKTPLAELIHQKLTAVKVREDPVYHL